MCICTQGFKAWLVYIMCVFCKIKVDVNDGVKEEVLCFGGVVVLWGRGGGGMMLGRLIIWDFVGRVWSKIENGGDGFVLQQEKKCRKM